MDDIRPEKAARADTAPERGALGLAGTPRARRLPTGETLGTSGHICGPPGVNEVWVNASSGTISVVSAALRPQHPNALTGQS